jgi:hypothetical protein
MNKFSVVLTGLFLMSLLAGCAGNSLVREKYDPGLQKMTFDEVLTQMRATWGEPTHVMESLTRDVLGLNYYKVTYKTVQETTYHAADYFNEATSESESVNHVNSMELYRFNFDKKDRLLRWYSYYTFGPGVEREDFDSGDNDYRYIDDEKVNYITPAKAQGASEVTTHQENGTTVTKTIDSNGMVTSVRSVKNAATAGNGVNTGSAAGGAGPLERKLNELKSLKDKKLITPEEYTKMREKALSDFK